MKAKLALVGVLVAVLALTGVGCTKVTGGGWFDKNMDPEVFEKVTFGLNAHYDVEDGTVKGQFQLVDHAAKINIHGTFDTCYWIGSWSGVCVIKGNADLNGQGPYPFELFCIDTDEDGENLTGDMIQVSVYSDPMLYYSGYLGGGNIVFHLDEE